MGAFSRKCRPGDPKAPCNFPLSEVRIYFQRFPGVHGTDAERGIKDVAYSYESAAVAGNGKTAADGCVVMKIRTGETRVTLKIFATTYDVVLVPSIDPVTTLKGIQARLDLLGYEPGPTDGKPGKKTDFAVLQLEANNPPLDTVGLPTIFPASGAATGSTSIPGAADQAILTAQVGV